MKRIDAYRFSSPLQIGNARKVSHGCCEKEIRLENYKLKVLRKTSTVIADIAKKAVDKKIMYTAYYIDACSSKRNVLICKKIDAISTSFKVYTEMKKDFVSHEF